MFLDDRLRVLNGVFAFLEQWRYRQMPEVQQLCQPFLVEGERRKIPGHGTNVSLRSDGRLSDVAPTILEILGLPQPPEMTGRSIIQSVEFDVRPNRTPVKLGR